MNELLSFAPSFGAAAFIIGGIIILRKEQAKTSVPRAEFASTMGRLEKKLDDQAKELKEHGEVLAVLKSRAEEGDKPYR
jgi:hypothetical protein